MAGPARRWAGRHQPRRSTNTYSWQHRLVLISRRAWPTRHELEMEVFSYIEGFYNTRRRHSKLNNLSPATSRNPTDTKRGARLTGVTSVTRWALGGVELRLLPAESPFGFRHPHALLGAQPDQI